MFRCCPSCGNELSYRDSDDPINNCVEQCENSTCANPWVEKYYETPADSDVFRKMPPWEECYWEAIDAHGTDGSEWQNECNVRRADAAFMKKYTNEGVER
jgi:hypothetical protein